MKRIDLIQNVEQEGCILIRHGGIATGIATRKQFIPNVYGLIAYTFSFVPPEQIVATVLIGKMRTNTVARRFLNSSHLFARIQ